MERRLRMMIVGSIAVWVPVASAAQAQSRLVDLANAYRLRAEPAGVAPALPAPHEFR